MYRIFGEKATTLCYNGVMARIEKRPIFHEVTRADDDGELETVTTGLSYFYEVVFDGHEVASMRSPDAALARRALYIAGMDIGAADPKDSPAVHDAVIAACEKNRIYGPGFPAGSVLMGARFGRSLMAATDKLPGFSFDEWISQHLNRPEES